MSDKGGSGALTPEDELINFFQSQQISYGRLNSIIDEAQTTRQWRAVGLALVASLVMASVFLVLHQNGLMSQRTEMVLREAALNHNTKLRMDAEATTVQELQASLDKLSFEIKLPDSDLYKKLVLVGGRYCTISGKLAAHLKLASPDKSKHYSLFLTPIAENLDAMNSPEVKFAGVDVKLWQEKDVIYALAKSTGDTL